MELTETQEKKLQTIGKRLCNVHKGLRTQLNKYHVQGDVGYFTNTHVALKFKNGILKEDIPVKPFEQSEGYPDAAKLFDGFPKGEEVKISVKDLLKQIRKERTNFKNGNSLIHFAVGETIELVQGKKQGAFHVDFKNLYEILLMADSLKIKEMTCYFHNRKRSVSTRPMLLEGEKMDALLCPVRIA